ncbi:FAM210 family protein [Melittangium boletus]|nr:FAM210 family protein [Melittangium boletus]
METVEPPVTPTPDETSKPPLTLKERYDRYMARFKEFLARYGMLAIVVHIVSCALFFLCFMALIRAGFKVKSAEGSVGAFAGAYLIYKATQIPRVALTFVITPFIDRIIRRLRHKGPRPSDPPAP